MSLMMLRYHTLLIVVVVLWSLPALAQGQAESDAQAQAEAEAKRQEAIRRQQQADETKRAFDRMAEQRRQSSRMRAGSGSSESQKFNQAVQLFREATSQYREGIGLIPDIAKPVRNIEKLIDPLKSYFNRIKVKGTTVDRSEFSNLSQKELAWETLTLAETIDNNLQVARGILSKSEREGVVDIKSLLLFDDIQNDLTRLRYLIAKVGKQ